MGADESAGPSGGVAEQIGIETNGGFAVFTYLDCDRVRRSFARDIDGGAQKLADVGFGPAVIDPIPFGLAGGVIGRAGGADGLGVDRSVEEEGEQAEQ